MIELSVTVKDEKSKLVEKDTYYEPIMLDIENVTLKALIKKALDKFKIDPNEEAPTIIVKAKFVIQM